MFRQDWRVAGAEIRDLWPGQGPLFGMLQPREEQVLDGVLPAGRSGVQERGGDDKTIASYQSMSGGARPKINKQIGVLIEAQKGHSDASNQLMSEHRAVRQELVVQQTDGRAHRRCPNFPHFSSASESESDGVSSEDSGASASEFEGDL